MKHLPIKPDGHQVFITDIPWKNFNKDYEEENELTFDAFIWRDFDGSRSVKYTARFIDKFGKYRYVDALHFFMMIPKMVHGKISGKFGFKKYQGSPKVCCYLKENY